MRTDEREKDIYCEVRNDFEDGGYGYIDAWKTDRSEESGVVVAFVSMTTGDVMYTVPEARMSKKVDEAVKELKEEAAKRHPFAAERMEYALKCILNAEGISDALIKETGVPGDMVAYFRGTK